MLIIRIVVVTGMIFFETMIKTLTAKRIVFLEIKIKNKE